MMTKSNEEPVCDKNAMEHEMTSMKEHIHGK
jgi:hypothetical protein